MTEEEINKLKELSTKLDEIYNIFLGTQEYEEITNRVDELNVLICKKVANLEGWYRGE